MTNNERAERAARNIVAGILAGGVDLGLVFKPEGETAFIAAIIEAIENEYPPLSRPPIPPSLVTRATLIALRLATLPDATKMDDVVAEIADAMSSWTVAEPELAELIEEARKKAIGYDIQSRLTVSTIPDHPNIVLRLITALEQQIAARQEAEINWKAEQAQGFHWFNAAGAARRVLARIIDDLPKHRDWLDPALEREAVAIANDDSPTESDKAKVSE